MLADGDDRRAFIHGRHEGRADTGIDDGGGDDTGHRDRNQNRRPLHDLGQQRVVETMELADQPRFVLDAGTQQIGREHRHHGQRQDERCGKCEADREGDGRKQAPFQALQRQQGCKDGHDDCHTRQEWHGHLPCRFEGEAQLFIEVWLLEMCQPVLGVLHDNDGAVDQQTDGDGETAERHDVGRHAEAAHDTERHQHRQGKDQRDDDGRSQVAEEQQEQQHDQDDGFEQDLLHRPDGLADQFGAVVEDVDLGIFRQASLEGFETSLDARDDRSRICAAQRENQSPDRFAVAIDRHDPVSGQRADADVRHVADTHDTGRSGGEDGFSNVVECPDATLRPDQQGLFAVAHSACAVVAVVGDKYIFKHRRGDAAGSHRGRRGNDFEGTHEAAQDVDVGNARHTAQSGTDGPVDEAALFLAAQRLGVDREHDHLGKRRDDRRQPAIGAGGELIAYVLQTLVHLGACPEDVGAVGELERHQRDGIARRRADAHEIGNAAHHDFNRIGNPLFEFLGRQTGRAHRHQDLNRRHVGKGVDRQLLVGRRPPGCETQRGDEDEQTPPQGDVDESGEHGLLRVPLGELGQ